VVAQSRTQFNPKEASLAGTKITTTNNGPLRVEGDFAILDPEGGAFGLGAVL
jgi:hypothetical protein